MSDWDGLKICQVCGDRYTLSGICSSCQTQAAIDDYVPQPHKACEKCGIEWMVASLEEVIKECPLCAMDRENGK